MNSQALNPINNHYKEKTAIFEAYQAGEISLKKLAELLAIPLEEAKHQLSLKNIPLDLGINNISELESDLENA